MKKKIVDSLICKAVSHSENVVTDIIDEIVNLTVTQAVDNNNNTRTSNLVESRLPKIFSAL